MPILGRNILINLSGQAVLLLIGFISVRFLFRGLGPDAVGLIYLALTLNAVLVAVLDGGITATTVREVATSGPLDGAVRGLIRTASLGYWAGYLLLAAIALSLAPFMVDHWIHLGSLGGVPAAKALRIPSLGALLALPRSLYASLFRGLQRMEIPNLVDIGAALFQQAGAIAILAAGGRLLDVATWFTFGFACAVAAYILLTIKHFGFAAVVPGYSAKSVARTIHFSSQVMGISIMSAIHSQIDRILVSKFMPLAAFGYYAFGAGVTARAGLLSQAFAQAAFPAFIAAHSESDRKRQYGRLQELLGFSAAVYLSAVAFAEFPLLSYVFDPQVARSLLVPTVLLCGGYFLNATLTMPYAYSLAAGRADITVRMNLLALGLTVPLAVALTLSLGLTGAALSWVCYQLWAYLYSVPRICRECLAQPLAGWYLQVAQVLGLSFASYGVILGATLYLWPDSLVAWLLSYLLGTGLFLVGAYVLISSDLRSVLARFPRMVLIPSKG
jgi:O-antigen/teichoic acid export membrane protein